MRRDDAVVRAKKRIVGFYRLFRHDVDGCKRNFARVERVFKRLFVDESAARSIDDDYAVFHHIEGVFVKHFFVVFRERAVQRHDIRAGVQFRKVGIFGDFAVQRHYFVVNDDVHAERVCNRADGAPDSAVSDKPQSFSF